MGAAIKLPAFFRRRMAAEAWANVARRQNPFDSSSPPPGVVPPLASDPKALMGADPGEGFWRRDRPRARVRTTVRVENFLLGHREHCSMCSSLPRPSPGGDPDQLVARMHSHLHPDCYANDLLHYLAYGYAPHLLREPEPFDLPNSSSVLAPDPGMLAAWDKQALPFAHSSPVPARFVSPLLCASRRSLSTGKLKKRICFDASRRLNDCVAPWPLRYADLRHFLELVRPRDFVSSLDLQSFYTHLPLHRSAQRLCQFRPPPHSASAASVGPGLAREFLVVPMGLRTACAFASAVSGEALAIIRARLRRVGVDDRGSAFIDDFNFAAPSANESARQLMVATATVKWLGLPPSASKTQAPTRQPTVLGAGVDTDRREIFARSVHIDEAERRVILLQRSSRWKRKSLQEAAGILLWLSAFIRGAGPHLRPIWDATAGGRWRRRTADAVLSLQWWRGALDRLRKRRGVSRWIADTSPFVAVSDASGDIGCGIATAARRCAHRWTPDELKMSMPAKELFPIVRYAQRHPEELAGRLALFGTDSITNVFALNAGSSRGSDSQQLLLQLSDLALRHDFEPAAVWVPREHNQLADDLSKFVLPADPLLP